MFKIMQNKDIKDLANCKKINSKSENILISKLEEQLTGHLLNIDVRNDKSLTFEQLGRLLNLMNVFTVITYDEDFQIQTEDFFTENRDKQAIRYNEMIFHEQLWAHLLHNFNKKTETDGATSEDQETVSLEYVYAFMRILMDPRRLKLQEHYEFIKSFLEEGGYQLLIEGKVVNEDSDVEKIIWSLKTLVKEFRKIIATLSAYNAVGLKKKDDIKNVCTFKPIINEMSNILGEMNYQKYKQIPMEDLEIDDEKADSQDENNSQMGHHKHSLMKGIRCNDRVDVLYKKEVIKEMKLIDKKDRINKEAMRECTFQPDCSKSQGLNVNYFTNRSRMNEDDLVERLYNDQREKYDILQDIRQTELQKKEDKLLKTCTFTPKINNNYGSNSMKYGVPKSNIPKDFYKAVGRMRFATEERERHKHALTHIPAGEGYETRMKEPFNPPRCAISNNKNKKKAAEKPFMYLDVNISAGKTGRIA